MASFTTQLEQANRLNALLLSQIEANSREKANLQAALGESEEEVRVLRERLAVREASLNSNQVEKITTIHLPTVKGRPAPESMRFTSGNPREDVCSVGPNVRCLDTLCFHTGEIRRIELRKPLAVDESILAKYQ